MSAKTQMNPGDTVYSQHGQVAELVAASGGEYIVRPIYEDDDGEHAGDVETWRVAFRTPPAPKLDQQTAEAEKRLAELELKVSKANSELYELTKNEKARLARIKQHDQLADLDRYLAGEMTHYVAIHEYYPDVEVIPIDKTIDSYSTNNGYGILTLCPRRGWEKKVFWTVTYKVPDRHVYSQTKTVIPCCGEEHALARAADVLRGYLDQYQSKAPKEWSYPNELVACCKKFAVDVPKWLVDGIASGKRESLERAAADQRKNLAETEAALAAIGSTSECAA